MKTFWMTEYGLKARIYPAIICAVPFLIFGHFYLDRILPGFTENFMTVKIFGDISIFFVSIFFLSLVGRFFSVELFENRYFENGLAMPSTELLLHSNGNYTSGFKGKVHEKIRSDFSLNLADIRSETSDQKEARKKIVEAVGAIRMMVGSGSLVLPRNIEYGFFRNIIGGSVLAFPMSIFNAVFFFADRSHVAFGFSIFSIAFYGIFLFFAKNIIEKHGYIYAKALIQEYTAMTK